MVHHQGGTGCGKCGKRVGSAHDFSRAGHWKALGILIGYLKVKETKGIIIRNTKVLKAVNFCGSIYAMDKETRNSVRVLVTTLGGTLLMCPSKTQSKFTFISTEAEYVTILE